MDNENPELFIHLGASYQCPPGEMHLIASYKDYEKMQVFFSKHFDTLSYTHDEIGFPLSLYKCKKGDMFLRDKDGELIHNPKDNK